MRCHENQRLINSRADKLELTPLGKWIVNSELGTFFNRVILFKNSSVRVCQVGRLGFAQTGTRYREVNRKGRLFMDIKRPRCHYGIRRSGMGEDLMKDLFYSCYNHTAAEMKQLLKIEADNI